MKVKELECPNCGAKIKPNQKFCEYCGTPIHIETENPAQSEVVFNYEQRRLSFGRNYKTNLKSQLVMSVIALIIFSLFTFGMAAAVIITSTSYGNSASFAFFPILIGLGADAVLIVQIVKISKTLKSKKDDEE